MGGWAAQVMDSAVIFAGGTCRWIGGIAVELALIPVRLSADGRAGRPGGLLAFSERPQA